MVFTAPCVNAPKSLFPVALTLLLPFIIYGQINNCFQLRNEGELKAQQFDFFCFKDILR